MRTGALRSQGSRRISTGTTIYVAGRPAAPQVTLSDAAATAEVRINLGRSGAILTVRVVDAATLENLLDARVEISLIGDDPRAASYSMPMGNVLQVALPLVPFKLKIVAPDHEMTLIDGSTLGLPQRISRVFALKHSAASRVH